MKDLTQMTKEERVIAHEIRAREETDPRFRARVQVNLLKVREELQTALEDISVSPEYIAELEYKVRTYAKILSVALKMNVVTQTMEDAFAEANAVAQQSEAEK